MGTKSPIRTVVVQVATSVLIAGVVFGMVRVFFPQLIVSLSAPPKLLEIGPSPTFICKAHSGDVVKATFIVRNITDTELKLLGVQSSCTCTLVRTRFPIHLPPGGISEIDMELTVGVASPEGKFRRTAEIFIDHQGVIPSLVLEATVDSSNHST